MQWEWFEKKENYTINRELESYASQVHCHICKEKIKEGMLTIRIIVKLELIAITEVNTELLHIEYVI